MTWTTNKITVVAVLLLLLLLVPRAEGNSLVAPGGVTPYTGGGGQRQRGYGYVRDPAHGFFVAGSTLHDLNGVYRRADRLPVTARGREWFVSASALDHITCLDLLVTLTLTLTLTSV